MPDSTAEFAQARDLVTKMLDEIEIDAYLFEIEPREEQWELTVECAVEEGWETVKLPVAKTELLQNDPATYQRLMDEWRRVFSACLVKK